MPRGIAVRVGGDVGRSRTYRESSAPHQTPTPAVEPILPFPLQEPSVYTTIGYKLAERLLSPTSGEAVVGISGRGGGAGCGASTDGAVSVGAADGV